MRQTCTCKPAFTQSTFRAITSISFRSLTKNDQIPAITDRDPRTNYIRSAKSSLDAKKPLRRHSLGLLVADCANPLGMENYIIPDSAITASSSYDYYSGPERARLHAEESTLGDDIWYSAGWWPERHDGNQWLEINLTNAMMITGIATQGGGYYPHYNWVESYSLSYSVEDPRYFNEYQNNKVRTRTFSRNCKLEHWNCY